MTRNQRASGFTGVQAHLGTRTPRFDGAGKIALGRGVESRRKWKKKFKKSPKKSTGQFLSSCGRRSGNTLPTGTLTLSEKKAVKSLKK